MVCYGIVEYFDLYRIEDKIIVGGFVERRIVLRDFSNISPPGRLSTRVHVMAILSPYL